MECFGIVIMIERAEGSVEAEFEKNAAEAWGSRGFRMLAYFEEPTGVGIDHEIDKILI